MTLPAKRAQKDKTFNRPQLLPLTEDLKDLQIFLRQEVNRCRAAMLNRTDTDAYKQLTQVALCQTILFNRRRGGETERTTLAQYQTGTAQSNVPTSAEVFSALSAVEQQLCSTMFRIEIIGKGDRKVPVLFYAELKATIDYLVSCFVFAYFKQRHANCCK